ncbi:hypothetical protein ACFOEQ_04945 [Chryseobacterium arachidis]|uniref:hypothetical protein n=1 Tax=Chryseobacterium arachidis TaxID=1416778 RepID=UPI003617349B
MKRFYISVYTLCTVLSVYAQETQVLWQKDIKSSTQDFLSQVTTTIDQQYLITGSSIQANSQQPGANDQKQNNGYDYHLIKLNQRGGRSLGKIFWRKEPRFFIGNCQYPGRRFSVSRYFLLFKRLG